MNVRLCNLQWDVVHEILQVIYNGRKLDLFTDTNAFIRSAGLGQSPIHCLMGCLEKVACDENAHYSLVLVSAMCLYDLSPSHNFDKTWQQMAEHLHFISHNVENTVGRQVVALQGLAICLPSLVSRMLAQSYHKSSCTDQQIVCQLFSSLFTLLQDNEKYIRHGAAKIVCLFEKTCGKHMEESSISQPNAPLNQAVIILSELLATSDWQLGALHLLEMASDLFLECEQQSESNEDAEEVRLFDKSKLNIYSDGLLLVDLLIDRIEIVVAGRWNPTKESSSPIMHLQSIVTDLFQINLPSSLIESTLIKLQQINRLALTENQSAKKGFGLQRANKFENFLSKLIQVM